MSIRSTEIIRTNTEYLYGSRYFVYIRLEKVWIMFGMGLNWILLPRFKLKYSDHILSRTERYTHYGFDGTIFN